MFSYNGGVATYGVIWSRRDYARPGYTLIRNRSFLLPQLITLHTNDAHRENDTYCTERQLQQRLAVTECCPPPRRWPQSST